MIMGKQTRHDWPQVLESLLSEGTKLAARWLPKGAEGLEQQIRLRAGELQKFQQSRKKAAALRPRKSRLLWLLPLPLIPATAIALGHGHFAAFAGNACAYGLFLAGAMLARIGFKQEVNHGQRQFLTTGRRPYKTMGALAVALATALTAGAGAGHSLPIALAFGGGAFAAFVLLYGLDPRLQKVVAEKGDTNIQRVTIALQEAEQKILTIEEAASRISQPELNRRLTRIIALAREILTEIARDPDDLRRARKFLNTYLDGTQRVVTGYADTSVGNRVQTLEDNFSRVLVTIEEVFGQQHQRLLENDLRDLDVNMEVLESQLKREGLN